VVTFASSTHLLYSADEKATAQYRDIGSGGGTEPTQAVRYARSVLANSQRAIKLFIAITDGEWFASTDADDDIRHLRKGGVITALGMIGAGSLKAGDVTINSHGCEVAVPIEEMSQLFVLAKEMVRAGIRKNLIK
jgi:Mg-chelatase subunit ChlD